MGRRKKKLKEKDFGIHNYLFEDIPPIKGKKWKCWKDKSKEDK